MKVLQVSNDLGESSGVGTFVRRINAELVELGVDSFLVSDRNALAETSGSTLPDFIHVHGLWCRLHHAAAQLAQKKGVPLVWSTHGMTAPWAMRHKWWKKFPAWCLYQRSDLRRATALHSTTELEVDWNRRLGLPPSFVVPLGTDLPNLDAVPSVQEEREEDLRVLFVGRIYPVKGLVNLVRAAGLLRRNSSVRFSFRLVGPDQAGHQAELESICREENLSNIIFTGAKHSAELAREYASCDVLVLPSFTENFGGVVVDALAYGKPVIASRFTPWKILDDQSCGWWVENSPTSLAKALEAVARMTPNERTAWGKRGRKLVETSYTWSAVGKSLLENYRRLQH